MIFQTDNFLVLFFNTHVTCVKVLAGHMSQFWCANQTLPISVCTFSFPAGTCDFPTGKCEGYDSKFIDDETMEGFAVAYMQ